MPKQKQKLEDIIPINEVAAYTSLYNFFFINYGLMLLESEIDEIIHEVDQFKKKFNER